MSVKFYNPFKQNIIYCDGYYHVRRPGFWGWTYKDHLGNWWLTKSYSKHCKSRAEVSLLKIKASRSEIVTKVIHD